MDGKELKHTCRNDEWSSYWPDGRVICEASHDWSIYCEGNPWKCHSAYRKYIAGMSDRERELYVKKYPFPKHATEYC